jgi:hypothetical protein
MNIKKTQKVVEHFAEDKLMPFTTEYLILLMHSIGATTEQISGGLAISKSKVKEVIAIELWEADQSRAEFYEVKNPLTLIKTPRKKINQI